jgi:hypothetical protein
MPSCAFSCAPPIFFRPPPPPPTHLQPVVRLPYRRGLGSRVLQWSDWRDAGPIARAMHLPVERVGACWAGAVPLPWTALRAPQVDGVVLVVNASQLPWLVAALDEAGPGDKCMPCWPLDCWRREIFGFFPFSLCGT